MKIGYGRLACMILCIAVFLGLLASAGWATVYYVATTGTDPATHTAGVDGTKANPWKSIDTGDRLKVLLPGDKVIVAAGTYTRAASGGYSFLMRNCAGTAEQPITYLAQGKVILDGSALTANVATVTFTFVSSPMSTASYNIFDGFEVVGGKRCLDVLGQNSSSTAATQMLGVKIRNCIFRDPRDAAAPTTAYGGYIVRLHNTHDCDFYNNIVAVTNPSRTGTLSGASRGVSMGPTSWANRFYNNTICIDGAGTAGPEPGPGPGGENTFPWSATKRTEGIGWAAGSGWNNAAAFAPSWVQQVYNSEGTKSWIVAAEGGENQLKNNIIWVKNSYTYSTGQTLQGIGIYDYTVPFTGGGADGHSLGLVHSNNMFSPAEVPAGEPNAGTGGLFYIVDFLEHSEPWPGTGWTSCPWPETTYPHFHTHKNGNLQTNSLAFIDPVNLNFGLPSGSPCIDAGTNVGLPYYGTAPDIGAVETTTGMVAAASIGDALAQVSGTPVDLATCVVTVGTGVLQNNMIYVEDANRAKGIAVQSSDMLTPVTEGQIVKISGTIDKTGDQPVLKAVSIKLVAGLNGGFADETPLTPLATANKAVSGVGLDNAGMLVKIYGAVRPVNSDYFCIDDGTGKTDGLGHAGVPVLISEQVTPLSAAAGSHATIVGVVGKKNLGNGVVAVIRPRAQADIKE